MAFIQGRPVMEITVSLGNARVLHAGHGNFTETGLQSAKFIRKCEIIFHANKVMALTSMPAKFKKDNNRASSH